MTLRTLRRRYLRAAAAYRDACSARMPRRWERLYERAKRLDVLYLAQIDAHRAWLHAYVEALS